jgi:hypothetical protein
MHEGWKREVELKEKDTNIAITTTYLALFSTSIKMVTIKQQLSYTNSITRRFRIQFSTPYEPCIILMDDNYKSYFKPPVHSFIQFCSKIFSHSVEQLFQWAISTVALSFLQKQ